METVFDVMKENQSQNPPIEIRATRSRDTCEPMRTTLYTGQLAEVPEDLRALEVLYTGWSYGNEVYIITVYQPK